MRGQERADERGDSDAFYVLDEEFHRVLCDLSGHATVWAVSHGQGPPDRIRHLSLPIPTTSAR